MLTCTIKGHKFGSLVYFTWQERNKRQFTNEKRSPQDLANVIIDTVKMRLTGLKVLLMFRKLLKIGMLNSKIYIRSYMELIPLIDSVLKWYQQYAGV